MSTTGARAAAPHHMTILHTDGHIQRAAVVRTWARCVPEPREAPLRRRCRRGGGPRDARTRSLAERREPISLSIISWTMETTLTQCALPRGAHVQEKYYTERWITWLVGRRRTQLIARQILNCRTHEHRHFERTLLSTETIPGPRLAEGRFGKLKTACARGSRESAAPGVRAFSWTFAEWCV